MELDRISLNFHGSEEVALARRLREIAGRHGINRVVKSALKAYLQSSPSPLSAPPTDTASTPATSGGVFDRIARR